MEQYALKRLGYLGVLTIALTSAQALAGIKCWTNNDGVRECGNVVPPEYAQKETRTVNERGITTEVRSRAKTPEELEAERRRHLEEQARKQEEERLHRERERADRVLLSTFLTEEDILRVRDRRTSSIDGSIEISRISIDKLHERLQPQQQRAERLQGQNKSIPEELQQDIAALQTQIDDKNAFIQRKEKERQTIIDKADADLKRFRELKSGAR